MTGKAPGEQVRTGPGSEPASWSRLPGEATQTAIRLPQRRGAFGLRTQVLLGLAVVALFAVISTGTLALWAAADALRQEREATASTLAAAAASAISAATPPERPLAEGGAMNRFDPLLRQLLEGSALVEVSILDEAQNLVASRPPREASDRDPPAARAVLSGVPAVLHYRKGTQGDTELLAYAPVLSGKRVVGLVRVVTRAPPPMIGFLASSGSALVGLALGNAVLLVALGYFLLTALVIRPLRGVEQASARVRSGDPTPIVVEGPREIVSLADAFNLMTASLASQREQLIRTEKLASVGQLAAGVAHEIGNPLAAILGYADLLRGDAAAPDEATLSPDERHTIASRIKTETQRIHRTISDLLAYSRPGREEAGTTLPLEVVKAARDLVAPMGSRLRHTVIEIDASAPWASVVASPERLRQVFVNLFLNAADAMKGQGKVTVSASRESDWLLVRVSDTGPGVPRELYRRIFDPFFTTKDPGQGTGLGLSICRAIVETFGGTLEVVPPLPGEGAVFVVSLRLAAAA